MLQSSVHAMIRMIDAVKAEPNLLPELDLILKSSDVVRNEQQLRALVKHEHGALKPAAIEGIRRSLELVDILKCFKQRKNE